MHRASAPLLSACDKGHLRCSPLTAKLPSPSTSLCQVWVISSAVLLQAGVHPEQPGKTVSREGFESLWRHSVLLLQRGFKTGSILTVDEDEAKKLGKPWTRR